MASLHKRPESPYWVASFQDAKGRWLKKSTKTADREMALKLAVEWENTAKAGREGVLVESQARKVLSEIVEQATGVPLRFKNCDVWFGECLSEKADTATERLLSRYRSVSESFLTFLGETAKMPLNEIRPEHISQFTEHTAKTGASSASLNGALRILSGIFQKAHRFGYILVNPVTVFEAQRRGPDDAGSSEAVGKSATAAKGLRRSFLTALQKAGVANELKATLAARQAEQQTVLVPEVIHEVEPPST